MFKLVKVYTRKSSSASIAAFRLILRRKYFFIHYREYLTMWGFNYLFLVQFWPTTSSKVCMSNNSLLNRSFITFLSLAFDGCRAHCFLVSNISKELQNLNLVLWKIICPSSIQPYTSPQLNCIKTSAHSNTNDQDVSLALLPVTLS